MAHISAVFHASVLQVVFILAGAWFLAGCTRGGSSFKGPPVDLPLAFHHDFRSGSATLTRSILAATSVGLAGSPSGQSLILLAAIQVPKKGSSLPSGLTFYNVQVKNHVQFLPDGLRIHVPESFKIDPRAGVGVKTRFGLRGDFEITAAFADFRADAPPGGYGVGLSLYLQGTKTNIHFARVIRADDTQGLLWHWFGKEEGVWPCTDKAGRLRFTRLGTKLHYLWSPATEGDDFKEIQQCEYGASDIKFVRFAVFTAGALRDVDVRVLDLQIRGQTTNTFAIDTPPETPKEPAPDNPPTGRRALVLLIGLLVILSLTLSVWYYLRRRRQLN
jgi:hypothetical protein